MLRNMEHSGTMENVVLQVSWLSQQTPAVMFVCVYIATLEHIPAVTVTAVTGVCNSYFCGVTGVCNSYFCGMVTFVSATFKYWFSTHLATEAFTICYGS